jgi:predicted nucleic acid-binding protein
MSDVEPELGFIDTNVWLYAFIHTQDRSKTAAAEALIQTTQVVISSQIINEVCINLIRKAGFDEVTIRSLIASFHGKYRVVGITETVMIESSELRDRYNFSFWDSLIVAAAMKAGATTLYSEDMQAGLVVESCLRIVNPFAS